MITTFRPALALLAQVTLVGCGRECYVGVSGTEASITVKASFPDKTCQALQTNPEKYVGDIAQDSRRTLYSMSERPPQPVVCEHTIDGKRFIVRDDGAFKLVGNILCSSLAKRTD